MNNLKKIDRFYIILAIVMLFMSFLVVITFRGIFSSLDTAREVDEELLDSLTPKLDKVSLDKAQELIDRKGETLDLRE